MGKTSIAWCDYTFNIWWGCFKISPGCANCYAATFDRRVHGKGSEFWDRTGPRRFFGDDYWAKPLLWNEKAKALGVRYRVFVGSMCDWAEIHPDPETNRIMEAFRGRLFDLIQRTPHLDWLLLSKRIENVKGFLPWHVTTVPEYQKPWPNVWVMTTVEDQEHADERVPLLLDIRAVVRGLSCEPLLGVIDLRRFFDPTGYACCGNSEECRERCPLNRWPVDGDDLGAEYARIHWVIAGAESGPRARACDVEWLRWLRDQCADSNVPFLLKQAVADQSLPPEERPIRLLGGSAFDKGKVGKNPLIEMPFLDGRQHLEFPEVNHAA